MGNREDIEPAAAPGPEEHLADERELWRRFTRHRDPAIREELVRRNLAFAKRLARRYRGASESFDDLLQVASLAPVNAVDRFDPERGIPFSAFASPTILGELKRHFRDRAWTVRVPRGLHDRMAQVDKAISELTEKLQRSPSIGEIAERLELEPTDVLEVLEANHNRRPLSLDRPTSRDDSEEATPGRLDRRGGQELRAGRGPGRPRRGPAPPRRARAAGPAPALRRRHDPVADRRADRPLADARLADPAPGAGADPRAGQGAGAGELKRIAR